MNGLKIPKLYAAQFPYLTEVEDIEIHGSEIKFTLRSGVIFLECKTNSIEKEDTYAENFIDSDHQNEVDVPYTYLAVSQNYLAEVLEEFGIEVDSGVKFQLTEFQENSINEFLKDQFLELAKERKDNELQLQISGLVDDYL